MGQDGGMYGALFVTGLLGSVGHCLGMCGPLVMMLGLRLRARGLASVPYHLTYHASRIAVYALLGATAGALSSALGRGTSFGAAAGAVSLVLGAGTVLIGLGYLGWLPLSRFEGGGAWIGKAMGWGFEHPSLPRVVALGALNGLLPCGLVYSSLLIAGSAGGLLVGAAAMAVFGAGTLAALLVVGIGVGSLNARIRQAFARMAGILIIIVGIQLVLRGLAGLGAVPHLHLGRLMLW